MGGFLNDAERARLNQFQVEVPQQDLIGYFTLSPSDRQQVWPRKLVDGVTFQLVDVHRRDERRPRMRVTGDGTGSLPVKTARSEPERGPRVSAAAAA